MATHKDKDAMIAKLQAELASAKAVQGRGAFTVEDIQGIKDKYHFFTSPYPSCSYPLMNDAKDIITFTPRSTTDSDSFTGEVSTTSIVGEFWTASDDIAAELDLVSNGIRRMTDEEIVRCMDAQIRSTN